MAWICGKHTSAVPIADGEACPICKGTIGRGVNPVSETPTG